MKHVGLMCAALMAVTTIAIRSNTASASIVPIDENTVFDLSNGLHEFSGVAGISSDTGDGLNRTFFDDELRFTFDSTQEIVSFEMEITNFVFDGLPSYRFFPGPIESDDTNQAVAGSTQLSLSSADLAALPTVSLLPAQPFFGGSVYDVKIGQSGPLGESFSLVETSYVYRITVIPAPSVAGFVAVAAVASVRRKRNT